jgi:hypothetical protein
MHRFPAFRILLVIALSIFIVATPVAAQMASKKTDDATQQASNEARKKIRKADDFKLKTGEPLFPKQAKSLAKGYRETAEIIARQGGDPRPVLDAAAYFESQSELVSRVNPGDPKRR